MAGFRYCLRLHAPRWKYDSGFGPPFAAKTSRWSSVGPDPGGSHQAAQKQVPGDMLNASEWWNRMLDKRGARHLDIPGTGEPLRLKNQHDFPMWLNSQRRAQDSGCSQFGNQLLNLCEEGQLERAPDVLLYMDRHGMVPSVNMYRSLLKACAKRKDLTQAKQVHAHLAKHGLDSTGALGEYLVSTLVKCGGLADSLEVFHRLANRTVFSWTALISGFTICGQGREALRVFHLMQDEGVQPNAYTFVSLLKACCSIADIEEGKRIHAEAKKHRCEWDVFVASCLVDMYGKLGSIVDAWNVFDGLSERNVVSWTAMLGACSQHGQPEKALQLYNRMLEERVSPDAWTYVTVLQACGQLAEKEAESAVHGLPSQLETLKQARTIQADVRLKGYNSHSFVGNTMISMFGKCGSIVDARDVFDGLSQRNVVSWNAILKVYIQQGQPVKALQLYQQMQDEGVRPNNRTYNILVRLHGKFGNIADAQILFDGLSQRDVISWNVMLAAYADQGKGDKIVQLYRQMQEEAVSPDARTFVTVLQGCGMCGKKEADAGVCLDRGCTNQYYLDVGKEIHAAAQRKGYLDVFLGSALISMYGKCGSILNASDVFYGLPHRNVVVWNAMLTAYVDQGQGEKGLELYYRMRDELVVPDARTFVIALQACSMLAEKEEGVLLDGQLAKVTSLWRGKTIHAEAWKKGLDSDPFVGSTLVGMYAKCGSIVDVQISFYGLPHRDVVTWTVMLTAYVEQAQGEEALQLYEQMGEEGVSPNSWTFASALQACSILAEKEQDLLVDGLSTKVNSLKMVKSMHANACWKGFDSDFFVCSALITLYGKCGSILDSYAVFDRLSQRDVVSWNAMLASVVDQGLAEEALQLYEKMCKEGVTPDVCTFVSLLQACSIFVDQEEEVLMIGKPLKVMSLSKGKAIHANSRTKVDDDSNMFIANTLIGMYGKGGSIVDAQAVFDGLSQPDLVSWNAMLAVCVEQSRAENALQLYKQMCEDGISPDVRTFVSTLQTCGILAEKEIDVLLDGGCIKIQSLKWGKDMHAKVRTKGFDSNVFIGNTLISMYGKCGSIKDAQEVFHSMLHRDVVSWNAMLATCVEQGQEEMALRLYEQLLQEGRSSDLQSCVRALQACGKVAENEEEAVVDGQFTKLRCLEKGNLSYADTERRGYGTDVVACSTLVSMCGNGGNLMDEQNVFDRLSEWDVVTWPVILAMYVEQGDAEKALQVYEKMQEECASPSAWTFVYVLEACGLLAGNEGGAVHRETTRLYGLEKGKAIHSDIKRRGYDSDVSVGLALVNMYAKCGSTPDGQNVFDWLSKQTLPSWTAMPGAQVGQGQVGKVLQLNGEMPKEGTDPNDITLVCVLRACSNTGNLAILRRIHHTIVNTRKDLSPLLVNTLISAYGRCASMFDAQTVFNSMAEPDVVSWNALIAGYARQGDTATSLQCYEKMLLEGVKPNRVTFLSLLSACSHAGLVDKGVDYLESMSKDYGMTPEIEHYVSMVDLLGRAGCFSKVEDLMSTMPMQPNLAMWLCLLGACRKHGKVALAEQAFGSAVHLQPKHPAAYILLSNIYADAGLAELAQKVRRMRESGGAWKTPGQSWVEHEQRVHSFLVGDGHQRQHELLYDLLRKASIKVTKEDRLIAQTPRCC